MLPCDTAIPFRLEPLFTSNVRVCKWCYIRFLPESHHRKGTIRSATSSTVSLLSISDITFQSPCFLHLLSNMKYIRSCKKFSIALQCPCYYVLIPPITFLWIRPLFLFFLLHLNNIPSEFDLFTNESPQILTLGYWNLNRSSQEYCIPS